MVDFNNFPIQLQPGLVTNVAPYAAKGLYVGCNNVRFYQGWPQKIGGYAMTIGGSAALGGPARGVHAWADLSGNRYLAWGTATKLWLMKNNALFDITPAGMPAGNVDNALNVPNVPFGMGTFGGGYFGGTTGGTPSLVGGNSQTYFNSGTQPRVWTIKNWGEDLVACWRGGPLYRWVAATGTGTAAAIVANAPANILDFYVSEVNRYLVALGAVDYMQVAWCDQNNLTTWTAAANNTAGSVRLEVGSTVVSTVATSLGQLVLTDAAAYVINYIGPPYIFSVIKAGEGHDPPIGPKAILSNNGTAYWMGPQHIFSFDGLVRPIPCPIENTIYGTLNYPQAFKIFGGTNRAFQEATFFCPDTRYGIENAVHYSFNPDGWSAGTLSRTSWIDETLVANNPIGTDASGTIYMHEIGSDAAGAPLPYSLETGDFELGTGDSFMHVRKIIPSFSRISGAHSLVVEARKYPQEAATTKTYGISTATTKLSVRSRGRSLRMQLSGTTLGCDFRMGQFRAMARPDGGRG